MAWNYADLRSASDEALVAAYDAAAQHAGEGLSFLRDELDRRERERQTQAMVDMTASIKKMTAVILGLTSVNVVLVLLTLFL